MRAPPIIRPKLTSMVWDLIYGILLVGGIPLATYWVLALFSDLPCDFVFRHYGNRPAFILQMIALTIATLATIPAFIFAIRWRINHRVLPKSWLILEVFIAMALAFLFLTFTALCYGPNDDWNQ